MVISERTRVPPRYRLLEEVGQGGMAVVYRAQDESLKRVVAVKVLHPHLWTERESKARLEREAQAVAKLKHPNILEIFDYSGSDAESAYIVTEFIDGETLKKFLERSQITHPEIAALIAAELAGALAHAHGQGIIHRDVKPENVMIRKDGVLKLMDFGIAQVLDMERMTVTGQLLGSPAYMAPELIEGRPLDVRTDVFSVGILLYQLVTGQLPFSGKNPHEVLRRISDGKFADPRGLNRLCGVGLCRIMSRALAHDPASRHPEMNELGRELREELAEAGLKDVSGELRAFFTDPAGYEKSLPSRMTTALAAHAQEHLAADDSLQAIACWSRVLAYAPDDVAVLAALRRLQGRNRLRTMVRYLAVGAAAVALVGGTLAAVIHRSARSKDIHGKSSAADTGGATPRISAAAANGSPGNAAGRHVGPQSPALDRELPSRPATSHPLRPRASVVERTGGTGRLDVGNTDEERDVPADDGLVRTFTLGPTPQNVDVYLDGERQFSYDTDHRTLPVPWLGSHVVEFRSPSGCCFVERVELGPDRPVPPDNIIARQLKWKPARLVVTTTPAAAPRARVMVRDPGHAGRGTVVEPGEEANIPFFPMDEGQKEVEVSVESGGAFAAERVVVRAGERKAVVLTLGAAP